MKKEIQSRFAFVLILMLGSAIIAAPPSWFGDTVFTQKLQQLKVTLGLDLAGGTELDYRVDLSEVDAKNSDDDPTNNQNANSIVESVRDSLERRVNPAGIGEILVQRSQVNEEEHILIQMPPSSNVEKAKRDAERDNRLEFFEEDPAKENQARLEIAGILSQTTPANWDTTVAQQTQKEIVEHALYENRFRDEVHDPSLEEDLFSGAVPRVIQRVVETQSEAAYHLQPEGPPLIEYPHAQLALVLIKERHTEEREKTVPASVHARHILFGYAGAMRAADDIKYTTAEEARTEAEKVLTQLQNDGTEQFAELAKEYSTEGAAQTTGGDLGTFNPGQMVTEFNDAVFAADAPGLLPELVETDFGYHIIEVLETTPESVTTAPEDCVTYEILGWKRDELRWTRTDLTGKQLNKAAVGSDEIGNPSVDLYFDTEGGQIFTDLTEKIAARSCDGGPCRLGIQVGGEWLSLPTVRQKIFGSRSQITGNFTFESAKDLADGLNLGAIDAPVILSGQMTIEPTLGADQLAKSLKAGLWGLGATMLFMIFMYRFAGVVASVALVIYGTLFLTILKTWPASLGGPVVLTLAGAAGIVLSLGLAVDGNILIFERFKEELRRGRSLIQAIELGFDRAWPAIRDSNLTTLLSCVILYNLGSAMIKGFAVTLIVGTLLSMFTAIFLSRNILRFCLLFKPFQNTWLYGVSTKKHGKTTSPIRKRHSK